MDNEFITWLIEELEKRGWSNSKLARNAGLVPSTISMVISGQNRPGFEFCVGVARALNHPPCKILRLAGLLPSQPEISEMTEEVLHLFEQLSKDKQKFALQSLRAWVEDK